MAATRMIQDRGDERAELVRQRERLIALAADATSDRERQYYEIEVQRLDARIRALPRTRTVL